MMGQLGFVCLGVIFVGLIVTWMGCANRIRWAWLVMFVIVWLWAFPVMILPFVEHWKGMPTLGEWLSHAVSEAGPARDMAEVFLDFSLMMIALTVPIKSLFFVRPGIASATE
jgi:hypothetical protein